LQLPEQYRETSRLPAAKARPEEFRRWLAEAERTAEALEKALRNGKAGREADMGATGKAFRLVTTACVNCHTRYRDVPQSP
jgi:hypothetical protein